MNWIVCVVIIWSSDKRVLWNMTMDRSGSNNDKRISVIVSLTVAVIFTGCDY